MNPTAEKCLICLNDLTSENLTKFLCGEQCKLVSCEDCLKQYFEGLIANGFAGSCPKVKCPVCPQRIVPADQWSKFTSSESRDTFIRLATILLSLQCASCHTRKSLMVEPEDVTKERADQFQSIKGRLDKDEAIQFDRSLQNYLSGEIHETTFFDDLLKIFREVFENENCWESFMLPLLASITDEERRATLHVRYLRLFPKVVTKCCKCVQCFRCRIRNWHEGKTCEEVQTEQYKDDTIITCENCDLHLVKGDGCSSVTCVCGHNFDWESRQKALLSQLFEQNHGDECPYIAALMQYRPSSFETTQVKMAKAWSELNHSLAQEGLQALWSELHGPYVAQATYAVQVKPNAPYVTPIMRKLSEAWKQANQTEFNQVSAETKSVPSRLWSGLWKRGFPDIYLSKHFQHGMRKFKVARQQGARIRVGSSLTSDEVGMCPYGTVLTVAEKKTLNCGKERVRITYPREWVGWATVGSSILLPMESEIPFAKGSTSLLEWLHNDGKKETQKAEIMSLVRLIRVWKFLYGKQAFDCAEKYLQNAIDLPPQQHSPFFEFTRANRHRYLHDIKTVGLFKKNHHKPLEAAHEIVHGDGLGQDQVASIIHDTGAAKYLEAQRYAEKRFQARIWENKHKHLTTAVTFQILDQSCSPTGKKSHAKIWENLNKIQKDRVYAKSWAYFNKSQLEIFQMQVAASKKFPQNLFLGLSPLCSHTPFTAENPLPPNPESRKFENSRIFKFLYSERAVCTTIPPSHFHFYIAWKSTLPQYGLDILRLSELGVPINALKFMITKGKEEGEEEDSNLMALFEEEEGDLESGSVVEENSENDNKSATDSLVFGEIDATFFSSPRNLSHPCCADIKAPAHKLTSALDTQSIRILMNEENASFRLVRRKLF